MRALCKWGCFCFWFAVLHATPFGAAVDFDCCSGWCAAQLLQCSSCFAVGEVLQRLCRAYWLGVTRPASALCAAAVDVLSLHENQGRRLV